MSWGLGLAFVETLSCQPVAVIQELETLRPAAPCGAEWLEDRVTRQFVLLVALVLVLAPVPVPSGGLGPAAAPGG